MKRKAKEPEVEPDLDSALMAQWMKDQIREIQEEADRRVRLAQTVGEHPMPVFANLVQHHAGMGLDPGMIAKLLGIDYSTLMIHYEDDVALGVARINLKIAENMVRIGLSTTEKDAARVGLAFLQRRNPAFADKKQLEIADKRDERIIDSSKLTTEERQQLRLMIERTVNEETE